MMKRIVPWLLVAFFAAGAATIGATFIFMGSLRVAASFDVYGTNAVLAGQPTPLRVWARHFDDPPRPVTRGELAIVVSGDDGTVAEATAELDRTGAGVTRLDIPSGTPAGAYAAEATLADESGEVLEVASFSIEVVAPKAVAADAERFTVHSVSEQGEGELLVEVFPRGTHVVTLVDDLAYVRVTERATGAPVADAMVELELRYGQLNGPKPGRVTTDALGLGMFPIQAIGDTDWHLTATDLEGRNGTNDRTLVAIATSLALSSPDHAYVPGDRVLARPTASRDEGVLFLDVFADDVWLDAQAKAYTTASPRIDWVPKGVAPPTEPRLVTLLGCFSPSDCDEVHARTPLVWSAKRLTPEARLGVLLDALNPGRHGGWAQHVRTRLSERPQVRDDAVDRAISFAAGRVPTEYRGPEILVRSEDAAQARLAEMKANFRSWSTVLLVLLAIAGGLMIGAFAISTQVRRKRRMGEVLLEADADEVVADAGSLARREQLAFVIQLITLVITIGVFVMGVLLLFRQL